MNNMFHCFAFLSDVFEKHRCSLLADNDYKKFINPSVIENMVLVAETVSHLCVLLGVCYRMLKPVKTVLSKRNKKKKSNTIPMVSILIFKILFLINRYSEESGKYWCILTFKKALLDIKVSCLDNAKPVCMSLQCDLAQYCRVANLKSSS
jgi:hypothetical protein